MKARKNKIKIHKTKEKTVTQLILFIFNVTFLHIY